MMMMMMMMKKEDKKQGKFAQGHDKEISELAAMMPSASLAFPHSHTPAILTPSSNHSRPSSCVSRLSFILAQTAYPLSS